MLSAALLRSAWVETDIGVRAALGGPLVLFLRGTRYIHVDRLLCGATCGVTDYGQAWTIDMESASRDYNDLDANVRDTEGDDSDSDSDAQSESDSESETDGDSENDVANAAAELFPNGHLVSEAYTEFLRFLGLGCSGSPIEGYPLVLVVLAGVPKSVWFTLCTLRTI